MKQARMPAREFMKRALYDANAGYFVAKDVVGRRREEEPFQFTRMSGEIEWNQTVKKLYENFTDAWFTPVELFAPWYSYGLARYAADEYNRRVGLRDGKKRLRIVEVGAGTGTNAFHVCNWFKERAPHLYDVLEYVTLEISEPLAETQASRLKDAGHGAHHRPAVVDATDSEGVCDVLGVGEEGVDIVFGLEVLDNLPHERVIVPAGFCFEDSRVCDLEYMRSKGVGETVVVGGDGEYRLEFGELSDEVGEAFSMWCDAKRRGNEELIRAREQRERLERARAAAKGAGITQGTSKREVAQGESWVVRLAWAADDMMQAASRSLRSVLYSKEEVNEGVDDVDSFVAPGTSLFDESPPLRRGTLKPLNLPSFLPSQSPQAIWVPTGATSLLQALSLAMPTHTAIFADFDSLPPPDLKGSAARIGTDSALATIVDASYGGEVGGGGEKDAVLGKWRRGMAEVCGEDRNAPLVAARDNSSAATIDFDSFLRPNPSGLADIFFPTDFQSLTRVATVFRPQVRSAILHSAGFLDRFSALDNLRTISGFNPAIDTFANTRVAILRWDESNREL